MNMTIDKFVDLHVIHHANQLIDAVMSLLDEEMPSEYEAAREIVEYPNYEESVAQAGWELVSPGVYKNKNENLPIQKAENDQDLCENLDIDIVYDENYEFWIVSDFLASMLARKGEQVADDILGFTIWGRSCTGQAISMDTVIEDIYIEWMEEVKHRGVVS